MDRPAITDSLRDQRLGLPPVHKTQFYPQQIDVWIQSPQIQNLLAHQLDADRFEKRNLISDTLAYELPIKNESHPQFADTPSKPASPTLDDRLVPAGIMGVAIPKTNPSAPSKTTRLSRQSKAIDSMGWILRVSGLILLCLLLEGLLVKWMLT